LKSSAAADTGCCTVGPALAAPMPTLEEAAVVKVTLRMPVTQATRLARQARVGELSQGDYVAHLVDAIPVRPAPLDQRDNRAAVVRSTATLAALSGDLRALVHMLGRDSSPALMALKAPACGVATAVDQHLVLAAALISALTPGRLASVPPKALGCKR
jgi:hypothetical protein